MSRMVLFRCRNESPINELVSCSDFELQFDSVADLELQFDSVADHELQFDSAFEFLAARWLPLFGNLVLGPL